MRGKLIENGVRLSKYEIAVVDFFLMRGEDIELLVPRYTIGDKNADIMMRRKVWEVKTLTTTNRNTMEVMFKKATKQSMNIIVDLRWLHGNDSLVIRRLVKRFTESRRVRELLIISKNSELIELKK